MDINKIIVLVEDDKVLGNTIVEVLQLTSTTVVWFKDGLEALNYFKNNTCDLVISDLMMPSLDGEALFTQLKKQLKNNSIPFLMITASIDEQTKDRQLKHGVNDYILKPFKISELIYKINNFLDFKENIIKQYRPNPFSKVTIKLSEKNFMTAVDEILLKNINTGMDQKQLAEQLFISKSTLDKRIRKQMDKNTSKYIREFKLDYAIKMIYAGEKNIQYIASETGFNSFSYFSTSFKAYMGISASAFMKSDKI